jgi:hypothetical protein
MNLALLHAELLSCNFYEITAIYQAHSEEHFYGGHTHPFAEMTKFLMQP